MLSLDARGIIAAVQVSLYIPIAVVAGSLVVRFALRRDAGWLFLLIFALTRTTDGALVIAGQVAKTSMDLFTPAYTLQAAGLAPLTLASLGFIGMVGRHTFSDSQTVSRFLRASSVLDVVALVFAIAGALLGSTAAPNQDKIGAVLRRVGACTFAALYLLVCFMHFVAFSYRWYMKRHRRTLLTGLFVTLPFLGARSAYAVLVAWSSSDFYGRQLSSNSTLAAVNPVTGNHLYFLLLSVVCELVVVFVYLSLSVVGTRL